MDLMTTTTCEHCGTWLVASPSETDVEKLIAVGFARGLEEATKVCDVQIEGLKHNGDVHKVRAITALTDARNAIRLLTQAVVDPLAWDDADDQWTAEIKAAHPVRSESHETYATAMKMVGTRRSKGALVALVNWLLIRIANGRSR